MRPILLHALLVCTLADANPPTTYRIAILDYSSSMQTTEATSSGSARRIDVAVAEIRQIARQMPPSPANPIGLVLFNEGAHSQEFTDLPTLEAALDNIRPSGGTAISPGLREAHSLLERAHQSLAMFVLLFTDGDNGESDGERKVAEQEAALDRLFASRKEHGLATHVICRRWANANNDWIDVLKQKPQWGVVDAAALSLRSVTAAPVLNVVSTRWLDDESLEVELRGHARVNATEPAIDQLAIRCVNGVVLGKKSIGLACDEKLPTTFLVAVKATNLKRKADRGELSFMVEPPTPCTVGTEVVLPVVPPNVTVAFEVPPKERTLSLNGELKSLASRWENRGRGRWQVVTDVELAIDIRTTNNTRSSPWPAPIDFLIEPIDGSLLVSGSPVLQVKAEGRTATRISLTRDLAKGLTKAELAVRLVPQNAPTHFLLQPKSLTLRATIANPGPARTTVSATAGATATGQWSDLGQELAVFEFSVNVVVEGPMTNSYFTVVSPPAVHHIDFDRSTLHSGQQAIRVRMLARCEANKPASIRLEIVPPRATDLVQYSVSNPLDIQIIGPPPVKLVLARGLYFSNRLQIEIPDENTYEDSLTIAMLGAPNGVTATGVRAKLTPTTKLPFNISPTARLGETASFSFRLPSNHEQSFWLDSCYEVRIEVQPDRPLQSIQGSAAVLQLVKPAPFKRWLFGLLIGIGVISLLVGPFLAMRRLHQEDGRLAAQTS